MGRRELWDQTTELSNEDIRALDREPMGVEA